MLCRIKAHWVVKGDDGVEARFLWKDLVLSKEDPLFSLVPHAGRKKASTGEDVSTSQYNQLSRPLLLNHLAQIVNLR